MAHCAHGVDPPAVYVPAAHTVQVADPATPMYRPAGHVVHAPALALL